MLDRPQSPSPNRWVNDSAFARVSSSSAVRTRILGISVIQLLFPVNLWTAIGPVRRSVTPISFQR